MADERVMLNQGVEARRITALVEVDGEEREMTFLGLVGMVDPPRPEARDAVETCARAGIRVVMVTGDHPLTAQTVARELGVLTGGRTLTGLELEGLALLLPGCTYVRSALAQELMGG